MVYYLDKKEILENQKWDGIKDKPSLFPPSSHTHPKNQITDFDHTHDDRYYTEAEIDTKFKNYCPISIGSIDVRYDNKNPAELYPSTTWELLSSDKYIRTGNTPLQTGGNNSVNILKENLPNIKLKTDTVTANIPEHSHNINRCSNRGYLQMWAGDAGRMIDGGSHGSYNGNTIKTSLSGSGNTGSISPSTEALGSGTALTIQPTYITLKFWKRLS